MKTKFFYGFLAVLFAGTISMSNIDNTQAADVVTVASSTSDELGTSPEDREEKYEAMEAVAEASLLAY